MQLVYQMGLLDDFGDACKEKFIREYEEESKGGQPDLEYFDGLLSMVRGNLGEIDAAIENASDNWKIDRISKVDLGILRLAVAEIKYAEYIPVKVSIDEAVSLAKKYGGELSSKFVNGVLGRIDI